MVLHDRSFTPEALAALQPDPRLSASFATAASFTTIATVAAVTAALAALAAAKAAFATLATRRIPGPDQLPA